MANINTVKSITDNLQTVLEGQGVRFSRKTFEDEKNIPASLIPFGEIFYQGENFEYTHGQKPEYAEIDYLVKVILSEKDPIDLMREQETWVHRIREALNVNALNVGNLANSKYVSRVTTEKVSAENRGKNMGFLNYGVRIRYREI